MRGWLAVVDGRIAGFGAGAAPSPDPAAVRVAGAGRLLHPGFIDVHTHGAVGHEVMDATAEGLAIMGTFLARHGVTSFLATTWTASGARTDAALETIRAATVGARHPTAARLLGAHLEGPYLNPLRAGAQDAAQIRAADRAELSRWLTTGVVRLVTLAPEAPGNHWLVPELTAAGVTASAGHTDASFDEIRAASALGLRHLTHLYNAMRPLHHRDPGAVGAGLLLDDVRCELIADTHHVAPPAMRLLERARGPAGIVLVSDAVRPTGLAPGRHRLDHRVVQVADGAVRFEDGGFAGSVLTLDRALRNLVDATGRSAAELWPATSGNAAASAGVAARKGRIAVGYDADLVLLDHRLEVELTVVEGEIAYRREEGA